MPWNIEESNRKAKENYDETMAYIQREKIARELKDLRASIDAANNQNKSNSAGSNNAAPLEVDFGALITGVGHSLRTLFVFVLLPFFLLAAPYYIFLVIYKTCLVNSTSTVFTIVSLTIAIAVSIISLMTRRLLNRRIQSTSGMKKFFGVYLILLTLVPWLSIALCYFLNSSGQLDALQSIFKF